jgi:hypothetical protein
MNSSALLKKTDSLLRFIHGSYLNENYMNFEDDKLTWIDDIPMVTHTYQTIKKG